MPCFAPAQAVQLGPPRLVSAAEQSGVHDGRTIPWHTATRETAGDRLDSWKEIAAYLHRDVTTVQRWEKREGMPVHRHLHDKAGFGLCVQF